MSAEIAKHLLAKDAGVRVAACAALGPAAGARDDGGAAWKGLRKGLDDREASVRAACARGSAVAAQMGSSSRAAYYRAVELFKDKDERVRAGAALAAARLEPKKMVDELSAFAKEKSATVLAALAEGLGAGPSGAPHKKLIALAGSTDTQVRAAAVRALAGRADAESRKLAASMIVDPETVVRMAALGAIDDAASLDALAADPAPEVAAAAQTLRLLALGRWATLGEVLTAVSDATPEANQVRLAAAWLRAK
jgi:HEAT repeat protein